MNSEQTKECPIMKIGKGSSKFYSMMKGGNNIFALDQEQKCIFRYQITNSDIELYQTLKSSNKINAMNYSSRRDSLFLIADDLLVEYKLEEGVNPLPIDIDNSQSKRVLSYGCEFVSDLIISSTKALLFSDVGLKEIRVLDISSHEADTFFSKLPIISGFESLKGIRRYYQAIDALVISKRFQFLLYI